MVKGTIKFSACFVILLSIMATGCSKKFIVVQSSVVEKIKPAGNNSEITITETYSKKALALKSVALNAPSSCSDKSASEMTGKAEAKGDVVKTLCGVEMAELERALVRQGFVVYSWKEIGDLTKKDNTPLESAKVLGAQVLFQVNSLERVLLSPGRDASIERKYFSSNQFADVLNEVKVEDYLVKSIIKEIQSTEAQRLSFAKILGAMVDISAIDTESGQTIWFYRRIMQEDTEDLANVFARLLMECHSTSCHQEEPENRDDGDDPPVKGSIIPEKFSVDAMPASEKDAMYFDLLRKVTADFASRFASGK